jgi:hypothetical protein
MRALGFKAWLEPTIQLGHVGPKEYRVEMQEVMPLTLVPVPPAA